MYLANYFCPQCESLTDLLNLTFDSPVNLTDVSMHKQSPSTFCSKATETSTEQLHSTFTHSSETKIRAQVMIY